MLKAGLAIDTRPKRKAACERPAAEPGRPPTILVLWGAGWAFGEVKLVASVGVDQLPVDLVNSVSSQDRPIGRDHLATAIDVDSTDGVQRGPLPPLVMRLPLGIYPEFDSYRAGLSIGLGLCDGLQTCLEPSLVEEAECIGARAIDGAPSFQRPRQLDAQNRVEAATIEDAGIDR